jgi:predicted O-methyltransferase YrrM
MALSGEFFDAAGKLTARSMGTELMGPLLYQMIRSVRPVSVLEVGMGYTTPFLARALVDNKEDFEREFAQLLVKTRELTKEQDGPPFSKESSMKWFLENPPLCDPSHYATDHDPHLHAIDNLSHPSSSAPAVVNCLEKLDLMARVNIYDGDFRGYSTKIDAKYRPFDFVWFDCGGYCEYRDFLDEYWTHISNNGGILMMHFTLSSLEINAIVKELKLKQATSHFGEFEILSMGEPHKLSQNSFTIVRKISEFREKYIFIRPNTIDTVIDDAMSLMDS